MGDLKREAISKAMRSCYPDFINSRKKAVAFVQDESADSLEHAHDDEVAGFDDVELFLADHVQDLPAGDEEYPEEEVAEVLASTWKDKRAEINRLQKLRKFDQAKDLRRSFRVEIEEMKRRTKCNRCGKPGHWARECRQKRDFSAPSQPSKSSSKETAASFVAPEGVITQPAFVAAVETQLTLFQQVQCRHEQRTQLVQEVLLVSSPGYAVLDSGCGKTIIGQKTLSQFQDLWKKDGRFHPSFKEEVNVFKFGNGERETAKQVVVMPIGLEGKFGTIQAAVVSGDAPLLLSRPALKKLGAVIDFANDRLSLFDGKTEVQLQSNAAGQYLLNVLNFPNRTLEHEVQMIEVPRPASVAQTLHSARNRS